MMDRSDSLNVSCRIRASRCSGSAHRLSRSAADSTQRRGMAACQPLFLIVYRTLPLCHKILTFVFLNITLESLLSILSPFHGFQESFGSLMLIGYARVSTQDQNLTLQKDALRRRAARKSLKTRRAQGIQRVPGGLKRLRCCAQKIHGWSSGSW